MSSARGAAQLAVPATSEVLAPLQPTREEVLAAYGFDRVEELFPSVDFRDAPSIASPAADGESTGEGGEGLGEAGLMGFVWKRRYVSEQAMETLLSTKGGGGGEWLSAHDESDMEGEKRRRPLVTKVLTLRHGKVASGTTKL